MKFTSNKLPVALTGIFASVIAGSSAIPLGLLLDIKSSQASPDFSYGGDTNPTKWDELDPYWDKCGTGTEQSPINLRSSLLGSILSPAANIQFNYQTVSGFAIQNNGHTIQVNYPETSPVSSSITVDGEKYELVQFHFHTPSEHLLEGQAAALELHLVHRNNQGKLAVVGVMIEKGTSINSSLKTVFDNMPQQEGINMANGTLNASNFLPANKSYYTYEGSLTTPPCSQGVKWIVLKNPLVTSSEQIKAFTKIYQVNARPTQDLNSRRVQLRTE